MFDSLKVRKRLIELEEQMLKLTRVIESHDLEWADMRARCKRLLDRTEKAARRLETEEIDDPAVPTGEGEGLAPVLSLSPSQRRLQEQIMRQRVAKRTA